MAITSVPSTVVPTDVVQHLAINGGKPVRGTPMPPRFLFGAEEKQAVMDLFDQAMREGHQVLGYDGTQKEAYRNEFAQFLDGGFAEPVNSGTNAVYVALRSLELEPGSEVIVPPVTDCGGIMPVPLCNLIPICADAAPGSYNIGAEQIAARITDRTSAIIVTHISGIPCDMDPILNLAHQHDLRVIEDCAQAHGAVYKRRPVGTMGDVGAFSLMVGKHHATAGQGGMVFTKHEKLRWKIRQYADRGKPFGVDSPDGNVVASLNCVMDELHACIGRVQLRKLPSIVSRRRQLATEVAAECCRRLKHVRLVTDPPGALATYWFFFFELNLTRARASKADWTRALQAEGVPFEASYLHVPMRMPWCVRQMVFPGSHLPWGNSAGPGAEPPPLPNIDATDARHIRLPIHEDFGPQEVADIVGALEKVEAVYGG